MKEEEALNSNRAYGALQNVGNSSNVAWHHTTITKSDVIQRNNHRPAILWFTGLSGSGKSTLANAVHAALFHRSDCQDGPSFSSTRTPIHSYILDGDNIRHGINQDLGFSDEDRVENIRRIGHVASLFLDAGMIVLTAFVSPFRSDRDQVRKLVNKNGCTNEFIEIYCSATLDVCEKRDTKGLYAKARRGEIKDFTGISSPYEHPENPELVIDTGSNRLEDCVDTVLSFLESHEIIPKLDS
jgi:adenylylsulfate kinase (apsK)